MGPFEIFVLFLIGVSVAVAVWYVVVSLRRR
jgi:hypothetical protein